MDRTKRAAQQADHRHHDHVQVGRHRLEGLAAREGQQLRRELVRLAGLHAARMRFNAAVPTPPEQMEGERASDRALRLLRSAGC